MRVMLLELANRRRCIMMNLHRAGRGVITRKSRRPERQGKVKEKALERGLSLFTIAVIKSSHLMAGEIAGILGVKCKLSGHRRNDEKQLGNCYHKKVFTTRILCFCVLEQLLYWSPGNPCSSNSVQLWKLSNKSLSLRGESGRCRLDISIIDWNR